MIYVYECTHPDCGAIVEKIRMVADADKPVACPCSGSHETRRVMFPGGAIHVFHTSGATRGALKPGWAEKINADFRRNQIKNTLEEANS